MNFNETTLSAIVATIVATGLLWLLSYAWKYKEHVLYYFRKKSQPKKHTIEIDKFVRGIKRWHSTDVAGIKLSITQSSRKKSFVVRHKNITEIGFVRKATPELCVLILKFHESSRIKRSTAFVTEEEFVRICKLLYFIEVSR